MYRRVGFHRGKGSVTPLPSDHVKDQTCTNMGGYLRELPLTLVYSREQYSSKKEKLLKPSVND